MLLVSGWDHFKENLWLLSETSSSLRETASSSCETYSIMRETPFSTRENRHFPRGRIINKRTRTVKRTQKKKS
jgi:hypothetical protein